MTIDIQNRLLADEISKWVSFDGKQILEVGCGNGDLLKYIAKYYSPELIVGIDPGLDSWWNAGESSGRNWKVMSGDAELLDFPDNSFDAIISVSTLEHIYDTDKALSEIKRVLKPYGRFYTSFSPIWTSIIGHHFVAPEDNNWNEEHLALIPPWGHLYMSEIEMRAHLKSLNVNESLKGQILEFIYHSNIINRKSKTELVNAVHRCGMAVRLYSEQVRFSRFSITKKNELTPEMANKIIAAGHTLSDVGVSGLKICLEKLAAC
ncbi:class I SAM-dependent methyltransferase [Lacrimispora sp.]|jgi:ubiquinone/menaquinone biosynthesis C-methylase UbiE|uniref:class I SAM-dependent methyltransferase n=1 Tax=Lacrimispora sp. TaxID=2719234 RepID=UPI0028A6D9D5|nr:methyltransferase domain-containing protein [Lacrimispora sp.]